MPMRRPNPRRVESGGRLSNSFFSNPRRSPSRLCEPSGPTSYVPRRAGFCRWPTIGDAGRTARRLRVQSHRCGRQGAIGAFSFFGSGGWHGRSPRRPASEQRGGARGRRCSVLPCPRWPYRFTRFLFRTGMAFAGLHGLGHGRGQPRGRWRHPPGTRGDGGRGHHIFGLVAHPRALALDQCWRLAALALEVGQVGAFECRPFHALASGREGEAGPDAGG